MTELEQHLMTGLQNLAEQYKADMNRLTAQNLHLQQQVNGLAVQVESLTTLLNNLHQQLTELSET